MRLWVRARTPAARGAPKRVDSDSVQRPPIGRALLFLGAVATVGYGGCAAWSVATTEGLVQNASARYWAPVTTLFADPYDSQRLTDAVHDGQRRRLNARIASVAHATRFLPDVVRTPLLRVGVSTAETYLALPSYKQAAVWVVGVNAAVFGAWLLAPRLGYVRWMQTYMTHRPSSGRVTTLLTSVFSHRAPAHFLFNNIALWSVGGSALTALAVQQAWAQQRPAIPDAASLPHFAAFFVLAGTFASVASHLVVAVRWRMAAAQLREASRRATRASTSAKPLWAARVRQYATELRELGRRASLGASGAIYAAFVLSACVYPQASVSLIFLPFTAIPIQWGMAGYVALLTQHGRAGYPWHRTRLACV